MLPPAPTNLCKALAGLWIDALQRTVELGMRDGSNEAQPLGAAASPAAGRLATRRRTRAAITERWTTT
jgi:hypothetical protein